MTLIVATVFSYINGFSQNDDLPSVRGNRYADAQDVEELAVYGIGVSEGDYIIDTKSGDDISIRGDQGTGFTLTAGKKIFIRGDIYNNIYLDLENVTGSAASPVIITNYFGQVEWDNQFTIVGGNHIKLTGKYLNGISGDADFQGHDAGYAFTSGTYGFYGNNKWQSKTANAMRIEGNNSRSIAPTTNLEMEYVEIGNGYFAAINAKHDNTDFTNDIMILHFHDLYIHDTHSEGMYLGYNSVNTSQHRLQATIENCRIVRTGTEAVQIGNGYNTIIRNNVLHGAIGWKNPFQRYQDNCIQFNTRGGTNIIEKNLILHGGEKFISYFNDEIEGGGNDIIQDNYLSGTNNFGMYQGAGSGGTELFFERNFMVDKVEDYTEVYPNAIINEWIRTSGAATSNKTFTDNVLSDENRSFLSIQGGSHTESNTLVQVNTLPTPEFLSNDYLNSIPSWTYLESWSSTIGEESGFPSNGTNKGAPNVFKEGEYVVYHDTRSHIHESLVNNNSGNQPQNADDTNWNYLEFEGNGVPNDDYRLTADNPLNIWGIGLLDNPTPTIDQSSFPQGSKIILFASEAAQGQMDVQGNIIDYRLKIALASIDNVAPSDIDLSNSTVNENFVGVVGSLTDNGNPSSTYTITGGADLENFRINNSSLEIQEAFDYETQTTAEVQLTATNGEGSIAKTFVITINDIDNEGSYQNLIDEIYALSDIHQGWMVPASSSGEGGVWTDNTATTQATGDAVYIKGFGTNQISSPGMSVETNKSKDKYWYRDETETGIAQVVDRGGGHKYIRIHNGPAMRWRTDNLSSRFGHPMDAIQVVRVGNGANYETDGMLKYIDFDENWEIMLGDFQSLKVGGGLYNFTIVRFTVDAAGNWEFRMNDLDKEIPDASGSGYSINRNADWLGANGHPAEIQFFARYFHFGGTFSNASLNTIQNNWEQMVGAPGSKPSYPLLSGLREVSWDLNTGTWTVPDGTFTGGSGTPGTHLYQWYWYDSEDDERFAHWNRLDSQDPIPVSSATTNVLSRKDMLGSPDVYKYSNPGTNKISIMCVITPVDDHGIKGERIVTIYDTDNEAGSAPSAPSNVTFNDDDFTNIVFSWVNNSGVDHQVEVSTNGGDSWTKQSGFISADINQFIYNGATDTQVRIRVRSVSDAGSVSGWLESGDADNFIPSAPEGIELTNNFISENTTGRVGILSVTSGVPTPSFSITGGTHQADFSIQNDNELHLNNAKDYETITDLNIDVSASNTQGSTTESFTISIESPPTGITLSQSIIPDETTSGTIISEISSDGAPVDFQLVAGSGDQDNGSFSINGNNLVINKNVDFAIKDSYSVRIRASNNVGVYTKKFTLNVAGSDIAPTSISLSESSFPDGTASGSVIGVISSNGNPVNFQLVAGNGDQDNGSFSINGSNLIINENADFSNKASYEIRIRAFNNSGSFTDSFTLNVTSTDVAPTSISLSATSIPNGTSSGSTISVISSNGSPVDFQLVAGSGDQDNASFSINGSNLVINENVDFTIKDSYSIRIQAFNSIGSIVRSFSLDVTTSDVAPTSLSLSTTTISDGISSGSTIGFFSSNGLPIEFLLVAGNGDQDNSLFSINGTNLIIDENVDMTIKDSYSIRVEASNNAGSFASTFNLQVSEAKPILVVTVDNIKTEYGEKIPQFSFRITGFVDEDDIQILDQIPVITSNAKKGSKVGSYDLVASGGVSNKYDFEYQNGKLDIEKANLHVYVNDATITYGDNIPNFSIHFDGFKLDESPSDLSSIPIVNTTAKSDSPPGEYPITVSGGASDNYQFTYNGAILSINYECDFIINLNFKESTNVLEVIINGGFDPYSIDWSTGQTSESIKVSESGNYSVTVTDDYNCESSASMNVTVNADPLSIGNDISSDDLIAYPNPASGTIYLKNLGRIGEVYIVDIFDVTGKNVGNYKGVINSSDDIPININQLNGGTYSIIYKAEDSRGSLLMYVK